MHPCKSIATITILTTGLIFCGKAIGEGITHEPIQHLVIPPRYATVVNPKNVTTTHIGKSLILPYGSGRRTREKNHQPLASPRPEKTKTKHLSPREQHPLKPRYGDHIP